MTSGARQAGFSLVEVLIAMFILALASALVVMTIPSQRGGLDVEADRFTELLKRTSADAIASGQSRGMRIEPDGYTIYRRSADKWVPARMAKVSLADGVRIDIGPERPGPDKNLPQIVLDSTGFIAGPRIRFLSGSGDMDVDPDRVFLESDPL